MPNGAIRVWHFDHYRVPAQVKHVDAIDRVVFTVITGCLHLLRWLRLSDQPARGKATAK